MKDKQTPAQTMYEAAVEALQKFCEKETELQPIIRDEQYPFQVQFIPKPQLSIFGSENIDENGEVNDLSVTVGLSTDVKSTLKFKMDSKLLKKLIKLAETVGSLYYHAFREEMEERLAPTRPVGAEEGPRYCPNCGVEVELWKDVAHRRASDYDYCRKCGQCLDLAPEPEPEEDTDAQVEEVLQNLRRSLNGDQEGEE